METLHIESPNFDTSNIEIGLEKAEEFVYYPLVPLFIVRPLEM